MAAFTIVDVATPDYSDKLGRNLDEIFEIEVGIWENYLGKLTRRPLQYHSCTDEDIENFYEMHDDFKYSFDLLRPRWLCMDREDIILKGGRFDPH